MLYIDCGHTAAGAHYTGIQRYVRRTLRHAHALLGAASVRALAAGPAGWTCLAQLPEHPLEGLPALDLRSGPARFDRNSHVFLADRFWHTGAWDALDSLLESPARISIVVYDLLSLQQPGWFDPGVGERFSRYLHKVLPRADHIVCLSQAVTADLSLWMHAQGIAGAAISVIAPGHRVWHGQPEAPPGLPAEWVSGRTPFVLQVGTVEPRKNHALTLAAVQRQWDRGADVGCLFIGQRGWLMESFGETLTRLTQLPQWQRRMVWLTECPDAQLEWCYRHAAAVVYPSAGEGYGLPLAEAASAGAAVVASDTPVHREISHRLPPGSKVTLCGGEPAALDRALGAALRERRTTGSSHGRDWHTATAELLASLGLRGPSRSDEVLHPVLDRTDHVGLVLG
jgi:glycosyltransferase involved in cell wall biosynthesis